MFDFHKYFLLDLPPKTYRKVNSLAYLFLFAQKSLSTGIFSETTFVCCCEAANQLFSAVFNCGSLGCQLDEFLADV